MSDAAAGSPAPDPSSPGQAAVGAGLVSAVVNLVNTGPVLLGAYTLAELTAVDAIVDFLEARPSDEVLAEAVRSLSARQLLVAGSADHQVQVRGDLGIAVAFQQRARVVLDARATGTVPDEPWRTLLLPQPEHIVLVVRIDALGIHELGLYPAGQALDDLAHWLPRGDEPDPEAPVDVNAVLDSSARSALVTITRYTAQGSAETAEASSDLVLARHDGRLHIFARDPAGTAGTDSTDSTAGAAGLVPRPRDGRNVRETLADLLA